MTLLYMKKCGFVQVDTSRGLHVKQDILCTKHNLVFTAMPNVLNKQTLYTKGCIECRKEGIRNGKPPGMLNPELAKYTIENRGRFNHKLITYKSNEYAVLYCEKSKTKFTTHNFRSEYAEGRTACQHCRLRRTQDQVIKDDLERKRKLEDLKKQQIMKIEADHKKAQVEHLNRVKAALRIARDITGRVFVSAKPLFKSKNCANWIIYDSKNKPYYINTTNKTITNGFVCVRGFTKYVKDTKMYDMLSYEESKRRIEEKHSNIRVLAGKYIECTSGSFTGKIKLYVKCRCTVHNTVWTDFYFKIIQTKHGCPDCSKEGQRRGISNKHSPSVDTINSILDKNGRFKVISRQLNKTGAKYRVQCLVCDSTSDLNSQQARRVRICNVCGSRSGGGPQSHAGESWLREIEAKFGDVKREHFIGFIRGKKVYVDGYLADRNTIFEFLGDYWHGNPNSRSYDKQRYLNTMYRLSALAKKYSIIYVWESDYYSGKLMSGVLGTGCF